MGYMKEIWCIVIMLVFFCSCKTSNDKEGVLLKADSFDMPEVKEKPEEQNVDGAPVSMWSPEQRKANAGHLFLLAEYKMLNGEIKGAQELYEEAYNLDPNEFLGAKMISSKLVNGTIDEVFTQSKRMVLLYPHSAFLRSLHGHVLIEKKLFDEAVGEFLVAIKLDDQNEDYYRPLITLYQQMGNTDLALKYAKQLTTKKPDSYVGWSLLSRIYVLKGDQKSALNPAKMAYELQELNPEAILIYAYILELNKKTSDAVLMYEKLYRMNPANDKLMVRMLALYRETGGLKEALGILDEMAARPEGDSPGIHLQRAYILWELQDYQKASDILIKLARDNPRDDRIRYLTGLSYEKINKAELALLEYESISEKSEFKRHSQIRKVIILQERKKYEEALQEVEKLFLHDEVESSIFLLKSGIYESLNQFEKSIETVNKGLVAYPNNVSLLFSRGVYEEKLKNIPACIATMRKVIELEPNHSSALNFLGYIYAERGENLTEAEQLIRKALAIKPNDGYFMDSLGWVYFQKGDLEKALKTLYEALKLIPNEGVILEHIGDVYLAKKDNKSAQVYFEKALSQDLEGRDRARIEEKLKKLKK